MPLPDPNVEVRIVTSYAREDKHYREEISKLFEMLRAFPSLKVWDDTKLVGGDEWDRIIKDEFGKADLYLMLTSVDSLASRYIDSVERKLAFQRHATGEATVVPIILRPCLWNHFPDFRALQVYPSGGQAISSWSNKDEAIRDVMEGLLDVIVKIQEKKKAKQP